MAQPAHAVRRGLLWAEFAALYIGAPLGMALFLLSAVGVGLMISSLAVTQQQGLRSMVHDDHYLAKQETRVRRFHEVINDYIEGRR